MIGSTPGRCARSSGSSPASPTSASASSASALSLRSSGWSCFPLSAIAAPGRSKPCCLRRCWRDFRCSSSSWRSDCRYRSCRPGWCADGYAGRFLAWPRDRGRALEPPVLPHRRADRHADRRPAGHRPGRDRRDAAADHVLSAAGLGADHARRHLLRRPVWRLDHRDPGQPSGRELLRRHLPRRLPDGAAGPRRAGARGRGAELAVRRAVCDLLHRAVRAAARRGRACCSARPTISR